MSTKAHELARVATWPPGVSYNELVQAIDRLEKACPYFFRQTETNHLWGYSIVLSQEVITLAFSGLVTAACDVVLDEHEKAPQSTVRQNQMGILLVLLAHAKHSAFLWMRRDLQFPIARATLVRCGAVPD